MKAFSPRVNRPELEADHPIQVKNQWNYTSTRYAYMEYADAALLYINTIIQAYVGFGYIYIYIYIYI